MANLTDILEAAEVDELWIYTHPVEYHLEGSNKWADIRVALGVCDKILPELVPPLKSVLWNPDGWTPKKSFLFLTST